MTLVEKLARGYLNDWRGMGWVERRLWRTHLCLSRVHLRGESLEAVDLALKLIDAEAFSGEFAA